MSLRLRLALWYGAMTAAVVLLIGLSTYALHSRAHYDDLDQMLIDSAHHAVSEQVGSLPVAELDASLAVPASPEISTRILQGSDVVGASPNAADAPMLDPSRIMRQPSAPAYGPLVALAPPLDSINAAPGAFGLVSDSAGERWRVYVMPLTDSGRYLEVAAPLGHLDQSVSNFAWLLVALGVTGCGAAFLAAWLLAGHTLRPIRDVTATATAIARSRNFSERVPLTSREDELKRMASTFNEMLQSLQVAYQGQQRFVADASHELRAPLTGIQANLELMQRRPAMNEADRRVALREASEEASRLGRLVAELLELARADAGVVFRSETVELDRVAADAVNEARHVAGKRRLEIEKLDAVTVRGDTDRLKELLLILLDNAVKYTDAHGRIGVRLQRVGGCVEIHVIDNGMGIGTAELAHVFERFYRADPARSRDPGGTGLGLSIARWIVERHGGTIEMTSRPGQGTRATVRLPALP